MKVKAVHTCVRQAVSQPPTQTTGLWPLFLNIRFIKRSSLLWFPIPHIWKCMRQQTRSSQAVGCATSSSPRSNRPVCVSTMWLPYSNPQGKVHFHEILVHHICNSICCGYHISFPSIPCQFQVSWNTFCFNELHHREWYYCGSWYWHGTIWTTWMHAQWDVQLFFFFFFFFKVELLRCLVYKYSTEGCWMRKTGQWLHRLTVHFAIHVHFAFVIILHVFWKCQLFGTTGMWHAKLT